MHATMSCWNFLELKLLFSKLKWKHKRKKNILRFIKAIYDRKPRLCFFKTPLVAFIEIRKQSWQTIDVNQSRHEESNKMLIKYLLCLQHRD